MLDAYFKLFSILIFNFIFDFRKKRKKNSVSRFLKRVISAKNNTEERICVPRKSKKVNCKVQQINTHSLIGL